MNSKVLITTSRRPSPRTRSFIKDLVSLIPGAMKINRGHLTMEELTLLALSKGCDRLVVVGERKGNPSIIRIYDLQRGGVHKNIVSVKVLGVALSREIKRPLPPRQPRDLYVKVESDEVVDFAEALMKGLHLKVYVNSIKIRRETLIGILRKDERDENNAILEFMNQKNEYVGPRIKLGRVREMLKG